MKGMGDKRIISRRAQTVRLSRMGSAGEIRHWGRLAAVHYPFRCRPDIQSTVTVKSRRPYSHSIFTFHIHRPDSQTDCPMPSALCSHVHTPTHPTRWAVLRSINAATGVSLRARMWAKKTHSALSYEYHRRREKARAARMRSRP